MGLFSSRKTPTLQLPQAPQYRQAQDIYGEAKKWGLGEMPLAYGARESALSDIGKGAAYYSQFQPTSFEEALTNQYFQNVYPGMERAIKGGLSLSGMESSPILAEQLGKARGQIGFDIGEYLSNLANQRAQYSLESRMGIDPYSILNPYANLTTLQSNKQLEAQYDRDMQQAIQQYQQELAGEQERKAKIGSIGSLLGMAAGGLLAIPTGGLSLAAMPAIMGGAGLGGALGGQISTLFGGAGSPISMGDAFQNYLQTRQPGTTTTLPVDETLKYRNQIQPLRGNMPEYDFNYLPRRRY